MKPLALHPPGIFFGDAESAGHGEVPVAPQPMHLIVARTSEITEPPPVHDAGWVWVAPFTVWKFHLLLHVAGYDRITRRTKT
jgi:hypothetical protein